MDKFSRTYNRPYQFANELRLFAVYRSTEHTILVGTGVADDAIAFLEKQVSSDGQTVGKLTKLDHQDIKRGEYDQLIVGPIDEDYPYRLYVVNPDDEDGKASNAIEFTKSTQIPVLDVKVDGHSVVQDQVAYIDLTGKLDQIRQPNKVYGTDDDGREVVFDRAQIEGVQRITLNGTQLPLQAGTVALEDIAKESKTVPRSSSHDVLYGTDSKGQQTTYDKSLFALSADLGNSNGRIATLEANIKLKQDKDTDATAGNIAMMDANGNSVDSKRTFVSIDNAISAVDTKADGIDTDLQQYKTSNDGALDSLSNSFNEFKSNAEPRLEKDWKSEADETRILNHPSSKAKHNFIATDASLADENSIRAMVGTVAIGSAIEVASSDDSQTNAIGIGYNVHTADQSVAIGGTTSANGKGVSIGDTATSKANGVSIGTESASDSKSVSIGSSSTSFQEDIAIGYSASANEANTSGAKGGVSVGYTASGTGKGVAIGHSASSNDGVSIGASSASKSSVAIGKQSSSPVQGDVAIGNNARTHVNNETANNGSNVSIGWNATTEHSRSIAIGQDSHATDYLDIAIGFGATASQNASMAIGTGAVASNANSIAFGESSTTRRDNELQLGAGNNTSKDKFVAGVRTPEKANDAATKAYVDNHVPRTYIQETEPTGDIPDGAIWFQTTSLQTLSEGEPGSSASVLSLGNVKEVCQYSKSGSSGVWLHYGLSSEQLKSEVATLKAQVTSLVTTLASRMYGASVQDGMLKFDASIPTSAKVPLADLNIFSGGDGNPSNSTYDNSIRSRDIQDNDIRMR